MEDSDIKCSTSASDEDSHKRHTGNYKSKGMTLRRSSRKRKQVIYMEDGHDADDYDAPVHQHDENDPRQADMDTDMAGQDTQSNLVHQDTSELNSNQMHTDPGTTEGIDEDFQGFELSEDHLMDSAPKEYLFSGGGFCMEDGEEQDPAGDRSGAEMEQGTSGACEDIDGVSESGRRISLSTAADCTENTSMEARGASSSSQRGKPSRGLSAMPALTKRRRK